MMKRKRDDSSSAQSSNVQASASSSNQSFPPATSSTILTAVSNTSSTDNRSSKVRRVEVSKSSYAPSTNDNGSHSISRNISYHEYSVLNWSQFAQRYEQLFESGFHSDVIFFIGEPPTNLPNLEKDQQSNGARDTNATTVETLRMASIPNSSGKNNKDLDDGISLEAENRYQYQDHSDGNPDGHNNAPDNLMLVESVNNNNTSDDNNLTELDNEEVMTDYQMQLKPTNLNELDNHVQVFRESKVPGGHHEAEEENQIIRAHKIILASNSTYFKNMFQSSWKESNESIIYKPNVDYEAFREVIRFLYCGKARLYPNNVMIAAEIGLELGIDEFINVCCECIKDTVSIENIFDYLNGIQILGVAKMEKAKTACMKFIEENTSDFFESYGTMLSEQLLIEILRNDELCILESDLFQAVVSWGRKAEKESDGSTAHLLSLLNGAHQLLRKNSGKKTNGANEIKFSNGTKHVSQQSTSGASGSNANVTGHAGGNGTVQSEYSAKNGSNSSIFTHQDDARAKSFLESLKELSSEQKTELKQILCKPMQHVKFPCLPPLFLKEVENLNIIDSRLILETYRYHALKDIGCTSFPSNYEMLRGNNVLPVSPYRWRYTMKLEKLQKHEHLQSNNYTFEGMEWYLLVYLIRKDTLEMYVCIDEDKAPSSFDRLTVKISFSVVNREDSSKSTLLKLKEYTFTKAKGEFNWGSKKIMDRETLEDPKSGFVRNGIVVVEFSVKKVA